MKSYVRGLHNNMLYMIGYVDRIVYMLCGKVRLWFRWRDFFICWYIYVYGNIYYIVVVVETYTVGKYKKNNVKNLKDDVCGCLHYYASGTSRERERRVFV